MFLLLRLRLLLLLLLLIIIIIILLLLLLLLLLLSSLVSRLTRYDMLQFAQKRIWASMAGTLQIIYVLLRDAKRSRYQTFRTGRSFPLHVRLKFTK